MTTSNGPDSRYGETAPNQYIPITTTGNKDRPSRRPGSGCIIVAVIALIAFCVVGGVLVGAALTMFWFNSTPAQVTPAAQQSSPTGIALAASATATNIVATTQGVAPTLTTVPTNTLPPPPPASATLPPSATLPAVASPNPTSTGSSQPTWMPCQNSYFSRLYVGDIAYVSFDPPLPNRVRQEPNAASVILGMLQPGERMEIIGGPVCSNQWIWWQVRSQVTGLSGWTAEGDTRSYWLVPAP